MFCTQCGTELEERHAFCFNCGKPTRPNARPYRARPERLSRPVYDKKIAGVCAGVARFFDLDVTLVRVLWLLAVVLAGTGLLAYFICWIVMPKEELPRATTVEVTAP